jgi:ADP-dependent phosphofructokinase/glucokinase
MAHRGPPARRTPVYVFEFEAGATLAGKTLPRSSRLIIRFDKSCLDDDPDFEAASVRLASEAGGAIVAGFNTPDPGELPKVLAHMQALVARWRSAGLDVVHLELASFPGPSGPMETCEALGSVVTSVGMSTSELNATLEPGVSVEEGAAAVAERYEIETVVVHGDWASIAVTCQDPDRVGDALLMGNLCAATRAAHGKPTRPTLKALPWVTRELNPPPIRLGARTLVSRPTAYLAQPRSTVGLGDSFVAGLVLALGARGNNLTRHSRRPKGNRYRGLS